MIRTTESHLHISALTDPGRSGKNNEDRFFVGMYQLSREDARPAAVGIVCDGIGGHRAGEVAAELAIDHVSRGIALSGAHEPLKTLQQSIEDASHAIAAHAASRPDERGMGSTCTCAWVIEQRLYAAYVGDSRLYLLRGDRVRQLSKDHTWIQEALDRGILDERHVQDHPNSHVIRRHLGSNQAPEIDFRLFLNGKESDSEAIRNQGLELVAGDVILICSDGLTDVVGEHEILSTVRSQPDLKSSAEALVELANHRGGPDNITLVMLEVPAWVVSAKKNGGAALRARQ